MKDYLKYLLATVLFIGGMANAAVVTCGDNDEGAMYNGHCYSACPSEPYSATLPPCCTGINTNFPATTSCVLPVVERHICNPVTWRMCYAGGESPVPSSFPVLSSSGSSDRSSFDDETACTDKGGAMYKGNCYDPCPNEEYSETLPPCCTGLNPNYPATTTCILPQVNRKICNVVKWQLCYAGGESTVPSSFPIVFSSSAY